MREIKTKISERSSLFTLHPRFINSPLQTNLPQILLLLTLFRVSPYQGAGNSGSILIGSDNLRLCLERRNFNAK